MPYARLGPSGNLIDTFHLLVKIPVRKGMLVWGRSYADMVAVFLSDFCSVRLLGVESRAPHKLAPPGPTFPLKNKNLPDKFHNLSPTEMSPAG